MPAEEGEGTAPPKTSHHTLFGGIWVLVFSVRESMRLVKKQHNFNITACSDNESNPPLDLIWGKKVLLQLFSLLDILTMADR